LVSGAGWAATGAAAINAIVSPWFIRRRPAALSLAYNGASVGGVVFSPLWVALIAGVGFTGAAGLVGLAMVGTLWLLAGRYFRHGPAAQGLYPDGEAAPAGAPPPPSSAAPPVRLLGNRRFRSLALATSLGLFAQIGLIAHLFSLLTPALGAAGSGALAGLATGFAILGRSLLGWFLPADADRRLAAAGNYALQAAGSIVLLAAGGDAVPLLVLGVALFGLGLGNTTSLPPLIAQQDFPAAETGRAVALVTAFSQAGSAFAPLAFGTLRDLLPPAPGLPGGHAPSLYALAAGVQVAALAVLLLSRRSGERATGRRSGDRRAAGISAARSVPPAADRAAGRIPHSPASGRSPAPGS
ncbi:MAG: transporter, partial [Belnapia sp.]|nr:transporter [Belnapia sp.]